jgi:hypothetical protein
MPALFSLSQGQLPYALTVLSGSNASVGLSSNMAAGGQFAALMASRTLTRRADEQTAELAACNKDAATACEPAPTWSVWGTGFGGAQWLNAEAASGAPAAQQTIGGGAFCGDYRAGPQTLVGAAVGLSSSGIRYPPPGASSGQATGISASMGCLTRRPSTSTPPWPYSRFDGNATRFIAGIGSSGRPRRNPSRHLEPARWKDRLGRPFEVARFDGGQMGITPFVALQPAQLAGRPAVASRASLKAAAPASLRSTTNRRRRPPCRHSWARSSTPDHARFAAVQKPGFAPPGCTNSWPTATSRRSFPHRAAGSTFTDGAPPAAPPASTWASSMPSARPDVAVRQRQPRTVRPRPEPGRHRRPAHRVVTVGRHGQSAMKPWAL